MLADLFVSRRPASAVPRPRPADLAQRGSGHPTPSPSFVAWTRAKAWAWRCRMVEHGTRRVIHAPTLAAERRSRVAGRAIGLRIEIENRRVRAGAAWAMHGSDRPPPATCSSCGRQPGVGSSSAASAARAPTSRRVRPRAVDAERAALVRATGCWEAYVSNRRCSPATSGARRSRASRSPADSISRSDPSRARAGQQAQTRFSRPAAISAPAALVNVSIRRVSRRRRNHDRLGSDRAMAGGVERARVDPCRRGDRDTPGRGERVSTAAGRGRARDGAVVRRARRRVKMGKGT